VIAVVADDGLSPKCLIFFGVKPPLYPLSSSSTAERFLAPAEYVFNIWIEGRGRNILPTGVSFDFCRKCRNSETPGSRRKVCRAGNSHQPLVFFNLSSQNDCNRHSFPRLGIPALCPRRTLSRSLLVCLSSPSVQ
jgi:hypothetical protein